MHLGNLMCCLLAWLSAKSKGGQVLLRIEDLDTQRCPRVFADAIIDDLAWLGLAADGPQLPVYQSERAEIYQRYYDILDRRGLVYPCFCSRSQLHAASAPHRSDGQVVYAGTCRGLTPAEVAERCKVRAPAWRVQVPDEVIAFEDGIKAADVRAACEKEGLLVLTAKTRLRLLPPLILTETDVDTALDTLRTVLEKF